MLQNSDTNDSQNATKKARPQAFIKSLQLLEAHDDGPSRGDLAALRAGLRAKNGVALEMMPIVARFLGDRESEKDVWFFAVGALFGLHPLTGGSTQWNQRSLGAAFGQLRSESDSIEKRFQLLLSCDEDALFRQLIQIVSLLKSHSVPVNWQVLLEDLFWNDWNAVERPIQKKWARDFYRTSAANRDSEN